MLWAAGVRLALQQDWPGRAPLRADEVDKYTYALRGDK
jgi:hypothetical protein